MDDTSANPSAQPHLYLASRSPRRREILAQLGVPFQVVEVAVEEQRQPGESPLDYVQRLAYDKAAAGLMALGNTNDRPVVLGSDTIVISPAGDVLEKPVDEAHAVTMLMQLSGQTHQVVSAVCLTNGAITHTRYSQTNVQFRELTRQECVDYWATGEPADKAGSYAIQGLGAVFVAAIQGSYSGVVGLPVETLLPLLQVFSIPWWARAC